MDEPPLPLRSSNYLSHFALVVLSIIILRQRDKEGIRMDTAVAQFGWQAPVFYRLMLGTSNVYLIKGDDGYIMVDAGNSRKAKRFMRFLRTKEILPSDIKLIIITHVHYDHVHSLKAIKEFCKCPVLVHEAESELLRRGKVVVPPGTYLIGKISSRLARALSPLVSLPQVEPDLLISDETSLAEYGVDGKIIPTPGHTDGSLSVFLASGEAFVGDLAINHLPFNFGSIFPPFASDVEKLLSSWQKLLDYGATVIYPGHGKAFAANRLKDKMGVLRHRDFG